MEKKDLKKSWVAPELIVLVRNKPEEAVLDVCKTNYKYGASDYDECCGVKHDDACWWCQYGPES